MTEGEKHHIWSLIYSDDPGVSSQKRKAIAESGTPEERELLVEYADWVKRKKESEKSDERMASVGRFILFFVIVAALWLVVSVVRLMWSHPLF
jgi:hypothetical protein